MGWGLVKDSKRGSKREWHELTQGDGKRGAVRKDRDANVVITNHYMHDDEVVGTRIGGLGKNGFLERQGLADQDSTIGPGAIRNQEWAWMKMARHLLKVKRYMGIRKDVCGWHDMFVSSSSPFAMLDIWMNSLLCWTADEVHGCRFTGP